MSLFEYRGLSMAQYTLFLLRFIFLCLAYFCFPESETALVVAGSNNANVPVGVTIDEVFLDPYYQQGEMAPFFVYRAGKKIGYSVRTVHGKTAVVPLDFDPHAKLLTNNDQNVSANSHLKPQSTSVCPMCAEQMLEAAAVQHFVSGEIVEPKHRELACASGHRYCFSCWSGFLQAQVGGEEGLHCLRCPSPKCGEMLDLQWAPVLLKSPDLLNRLMVQRQRQVMLRTKLQWCPTPQCGLIVHVHTPGEVRGPSCTAGAIPQCGVCANGHGFCLCCGGEAHSPCSCAQLGDWQALVRDMSHRAEARERGHPSNILMHAPNHKNCSQCGASNGKEFGSNHMR